MLCLRRKSGEAVILELPNGCIITVRVDSIGRGTVRFNVDAPKSIAVDREEVFKSRQAKRKEPQQ